LQYTGATEKLRFDWMIWEAFRRQHKPKHV
jgi:hypothetical protein